MSPPASRKKPVLSFSQFQKRIVFIFEQRRFFFALAGDLELGKLL